MKKALVISSYPSKGSVHGKGTVGVASYAKNTLEAIQNVSGEVATNFTVLAEKLGKERNYTENKISVKHLWKRNSFLTFYYLLKEILTKEKDSNTIIIEFELSMFGSFLYLLPFPLFLLALLLLRKKIILVCHQVLPNIEEIGPHINLHGASFSADLHNIGLSIFYRIMLLTCHKVIVFEDVLKERLAHFGKKEKIVTVPHGVEDFSSKTTKIGARKRLKIEADSFVLLSFGFLAWYKGTDWIVNAIQNIEKSHPLRAKKIQLILAGGPNPNHMDKDYYVRYLNHITEQCKNSNITITGFVEEKDIPDYYMASDLVVLPYRTFMSSSGPLSITYSFKKPFLLSSKLKGVLNTEDIIAAMKKLHLKEDSIFFKDIDEDFEEKVHSIQKSSSLQKKLTQLSQEIKNQRSWNVIGRRYYEEIFA